jgi:tetratricopeptide (TPR) repeat protein
MPKKLSSLTLSRRLAHLFLALCLLLTPALSGCASLRERPGEAAPGVVPESPKSLAFYHYLKAQHQLLADDLEGAIREYEEALKEDPNSATMELEVAILYQRQGEAKKALAHVEKALKLNPDMQDAYFVLAGLHVGLNQLQEAIQEYERILVMDPDNREARLFLAALYAQQRQFPKAIHAIEEILRLEPKSVVGRYYLGRFYLESDKLAEARQQFHRVLAMDPKFVPAIFDLAVILEKEKQYNRALVMYRRVLRHQPGNARAWANIGRVLLILNRYAEAQRAFRKVKALEKNEPAAQFNIGLICLEQKLPEDAIRELRPLLSNPRYQDRARYYIAMALEEKGDLKAACREYQLVDRTAEQFIPARLRLAYLLYQLGEKERARHLLDDLRKLAPHREEIYLTESYFLEEENLWDRAIKVLEAGVNKVARPAELYYHLAVLFEKTSNREESIKNIKKVLELDPDNPDAQNFLGYTYAEAGIHLDEAEKLIRSALRAKPESGHIIDSLGWVLYKKGEYGKAAEELERAHKIMPNDGTVAEHLGDAYLQQKRYPEALRLFRQAEGLENADVNQLRQKIKKLEQLHHRPGQGI